MELSKEMNQRVKEAGKDTAWVERLRAVATWEKYVALLDEKGIEAPEGLKEIFVASRPDKTGELADEELEKVSGGFGPILPCPKEYNYYLCELSRCPHLEMLQNTNIGYCDVHNWWVNN